MYVNPGYFNFSQLRFPEEGVDTKDKTTLQNFYLDEHLYPTQRTTMESMVSLVAGPPDDPSVKNAENVANVFQELEAKLNHQLKKPTLTVQNLREMESELCEAHTGLQRLFEMMETSEPKGDFNHAWTLIRGYRDDVKQHIDSVQKKKREKDAILEQFPIQVDRDRFAGIGWILETLPTDTTDYKDDQIHLIRVGDQLWLEVASQENIHLFLDVNNHHITVVVGEREENLQKALQEEVPLPSIDTPLKPAKWIQDWARGLIFLQDFFLQESSLNEKKVAVVALHSPFPGEEPVIARYVVPSEGFQVQSAWEIRMGLALNDELCQMLYGKKYISIEKSTPSLGRDLQGNTHLPKMVARLDQWFSDLNAQIREEELWRDRPGVSIKGKIPHYRGLAGKHLKTAKLEEEDYVKAAREAYQFLIQELESLSEEDDDEIFRTHLQLFSETIKLLSGQSKLKLTLVVKTHERLHSLKKEWQTISPITLAQVCRMFLQIDEKIGKQSLPLPYENIQTTLKMPGNPPDKFIEVTLFEIGKVGKHPIVIRWQTGDLLVLKKSQNVEQDLKWHSSLEEASPTTFGYIDHNGSAYIVEKLIEGENLENQERLGKVALTAVMHQAFASLAVIHGKGKVWGDVRAKHFVFHPESNRLYLVNVSHIGENKFRRDNFPDLPFEFFTTSSFVAQAIKHFLDEIKPTKSSDIAMVGAICHRLCLLNLYDSSPFPTWRPMMEKCVECEIDAIEIAKVGEISRQIRSEYWKNTHYKRIEHSWFSGSETKEFVALVAPELEMAYAPSPEERKSAKDLAQTMQMIHKKIKEGRGIQDDESS